MSDGYFKEQRVPRRDFLKTMGAVGALLSIAETGPSASGQAVQTMSKRKVSIFSKHLQWLDYQGMANAAAEIGFDGINLSVRPKGHVLPERVEQDLPKAVEAVRKAGLDVPMMVTGINKVSDPCAEQVLKTASALGIRFYRTSYIEYDLTKSIDDNLKTIQSQLKELADMNRHYRIRGSCQNHAGSRFSSALWDLWTVLKKIRSEWLGCEFDIRHAMVEGANSWPVALRALAPFVNYVDVKDFYWKKIDGKWDMEDCPLGEGMVDLKAFFRLLNELNLITPVDLHFEYDLGLPSDPKQVTPAERDRVIAMMKKDLKYLRPLI
jgi:sugar phosphate isomerase/epimerase